MAKAKLLRRALTPPEARLWLLLKGRKLGGLQWRKQHPIGPYILDFFCGEAQLCVEVDGMSHEFTMTRDDRRDTWLVERGIETFRVPAEAVRVTPEAVLAHILDAAHARIAGSRPPQSSGFAR